MEASPLCVIYQLLSELNNDIPVTWITIADHDFPPRGGSDAGLHADQAWRPASERIISVASCRCLVTTLGKTAIRQIDEIPCNARPDHTFGSFSDRSPCFRHDHFTPRHDGLAS